MEESYQEMAKVLDTEIARVIRSSKRLQNKVQPVIESVEDQIILTDFKVTLSNEEYENEILKNDDPPYSMFLLDTMQERRIQSLQI